LEAALFELLSALLNLSAVLFAAEQLDVAGPVENNSGPSIK